MHDAFLTFVNDYVPGLSSKKTLLAVSGGVDSMVMAELFCRAGFPCAIAHCNFGLRGAESDEDENFVREWAKREGVELHVEHFATARKAESEGISIQMAARDLRYAWFGQLIREFEYDYLATAHHTDDNIETVLLNLTRGTGLPGLLGIAPLRAQLIRPLLFNSKNEILDFAQKQGLTWREDSSNASDAYRRNLLRHQILPVLRETNPSLDKTFNQNQDRLRAVDSLMAELISEWRRKLVRVENQTIFVSIPAIQQASEPTYILHEILQDYGFSYVQTKQIVANLGAISGKQFFSANHSLLKDRENLIVERLGVLSDFRPVTIHENSNGAALSGNSCLLISRMKNSPDLDFRANALTAYFDAARLRFPLSLRSWQAGDKLRPFGMGGKVKKVSDLLVDAKVPRNRKKDCMILLDNDQTILWVLGLRTDERFKINPETAELLRFDIVESCS